MRVASQRMNEAFEANMRVTFERLNETTRSATRALDESNMAFHELSEIGRLPPIPQIPPMRRLTGVIDEWGDSDFGGGGGGAGETITVLSYDTFDRPRRRRTKKKKEPESPTPLIEQNAPRKMRIRDDD